WRVQLDTYEREVESYGGNNKSIEIAERIFHIDSEAVLNILKLIMDEGDPDTRWHVTICGIHKLLCDFGLDIHNRIQILIGLVEGLKNKFNCDNFIEEQLSMKFRSKRELIENSLSDCSMLLTTSSIAGNT